MDSVVRFVEEVVRQMQRDRIPQWDSRYPSRRDFAVDIARQELHLFESEDSLQGIICLNSRQSPEYKGAAWSFCSSPLVIHRMAASPRFARQGIGSRLLDYAQMQARTKGISYLRADTFSLNYKMNSLFLKMGFTKVGELCFPYKKAPFYCYEKCLAEGAPADTAR